MTDGSAFVIGRGFGRSRCGNSFGSARRHSSHGSFRSRRLFFGGHINPSRAVGNSCGSHRRNTAGHCGGTHCRPGNARGFGRRCSGGCHETPRGPGDKTDRGGSKRTFPAKKIESGGTGRFSCFPWESEICPVRLRAGTPGKHAGADTAARTPGAGRWCALAVNNQAFSSTRSSAERRPPLLRSST